MYLIRIYMQNAAHFTVAVAILLTPMVMSPGSLTAQSADRLAVSWGVTDNYVGGPDYFESELVLKNQGATPLGDRWAIYFNFIRRVWSDSLTGPISIRLINGSYYEMKPQPEFSLGAGDSVTVRIIASNWAIRESAAPSGFYLVGSDGRPQSIRNVRIEPFVAPRQVNRYEADRLPVATARTRFDQNRRVSMLPRGAFSTVIPRPRHAAFEDAAYLLAPPVTVHSDAASNAEGKHLASMLKEWFGMDSENGTDRDGVDVSLSIAPDTLAGTVCAKPEGYRVRIDGTGIRVVGFDESGVFYGIQTVVALIDPSAIGNAGKPVALPQAEIIDCPRFPYRSLMIDVARHFHPPERIEQAMRFMAFYKLNRLHFHLSDDEGWRLQVASLPELTTVGARRGHTLDSKNMLPPSFGSGPDPETSPGSGFYSRDEFVELLRFAKRRHIEVVPEIDSPGHMRAAVKAMEQRYRRFLAEGDSVEATRYLLTDPSDTSSYRSVQGWDDNVANVCLESTFRFMTKVIDELSDLFEEAGAPLTMLHLGGDEVPHGAWEGSPACGRLIASRDDLSDAHYLSDNFFRRVVGYLDSKGLKAAGWEEIGLGVRTGDDYEPEIAKPDFADKVIPFAWNSVWGWGGEERAYRLANAGYQVVMANAPNLYFDLAAEKHPEEPGFAWGGFVDERRIFEMTPLNIYNSAYEDRLGRLVDPDEYRDAVRLDSSAVENILGIQGQLWGENTPSKARFEYHLFPKLVALAERAWVRMPGWELTDNREDRIKLLDADWNSFANSLGQIESLRLAKLFGGVGYRIPPPGARIVDGILYANVAFPGLSIRYTTDGSEPDFDSTLWTEPVPAEGTIMVRSFDATGRGGRAVQVIDP